MRRPRRLFDDAELARLDDLLADGATYAEAGQILGRWPASIGRRARRHGMSDTRKSRITPQQAARALDLYRRRLRVEDVLAATGISQGSLYNLLKEHGVPPRRPRCKVVYTSTVKCFIDKTPPFMV